MFFPSASGLMLAVCLLTQAPAGSAPTECQDWQECRRLALDAEARHDYERFHDLAWRTVQMGPPRNPELMYLLARAQSLSRRPHDALVMRNHGLLTCGATIQQAFNTMYQLELSCRSQVDAMAARTELTMPGENVLAHTAHLYQPGTRRPYGVLEWPAMLRLLEAEERNSGYPPYWH